MIRTRPARPKDAATIVDFQLRMAWETERLHLDRPTVGRGVRAVFRDASKGRYRVAELEGRVVGVMLTTPEWSDWRNGTVMWIQSLYVVPEARRAGAFRALYEGLRRELAGRRGLKGIRLYVARGNRPAQRAYRAMGMEGDRYLVYEWMK